jgi:hypothetical protein
MRRSDCSGTSWTRVSTSILCSEGQKGSASEAFEKFRSRIGNPIVRAEGVDDAAASRVAR